MREKGQEMGPRRDSTRSDLILALLMLGSLFVLGTLGYMGIEGWSAFDSFYMTVITLATIGYGETHPLTTLGRAFTIVLIFFGIGIGTALIGSVWRAAVEGITDCP